LATQASWELADATEDGILGLILLREVNTHVQLQYYCEVCCMVWKSSWGEFNGNVLVAEDLVALLLR
jgi:hypothetical protein